MAEEVPLMLQDVEPKKKRPKGEVPRGELGKLLDGKTDWIRDGFGPLDRLTKSDAELLGEKLGKKVGENIKKKRLDMTPSTEGYPEEDDVRDGPVRGGFKVQGEHLEASYKGRYVPRSHEIEGDFLEPPVMDAPQEEVVVAPPEVEAAVEKEPEDDGGKFLSSDPTDKTDDAVAKTDPKEDRIANIQDSVTQERKGPSPSKELKGSLNLGSVLRHKWLRDHQPDPAMSNEEMVAYLLSSTLPGLLGHAISGPRGGSAAQKLGGLPVAKMFGEERIRKIAAAKDKSDAMDDFMIDLAKLDEKQRETELLGLGFGLKTSKDKRDWFALANQLGKTRADVAKITHSIQQDLVDSTRKDEEGYYKNQLAQANAELRRQQTRNALIQADRIKAQTDLDKVNADLNKARKGLVTAQTTTQGSIATKNYAQAAKARNTKDKALQPKAWQYKAAMFAKRMERSLKALDELRKKGFDPTTFVNSTQVKAPDLANGLLSEDAQRYKNNLKLYISAVLRRETGAAIKNEETIEYSSKFGSYWNQSAKNRKEVEAHRRDALAAMIEEAGPAYDRVKVRADSMDDPKEGMTLVVDGKEITERQLHKTGYRKVEGVLYVETPGGKWVPVKER